MGGQAAELVYLLARRELWLLVSVGFVDPYHHKRFELLKDAAFRQRLKDAATLIADEYATVKLGPGEVMWKQFSPEDLFAALDAELVTIETAYRQLFGLTAVSGQCPACEVEFETNTDPAYRSQRLGDVAAFYRAFGLQVSEDAGERIDHITMEAEFLYVLLAKEAAALQNGDAGGVEICRDARMKFFQEHVGWWLPALGRLVSRLSSSPFYRQLAVLTAGLSALERICLGLSSFTTRAMPKSSPLEAEATCFDCTIQAGLDKYPN